MLKNNTLLNASPYEKTTTYSSETEEDARGYITRLTVEYTGDKIVKAHLIGIRHLPPTNEVNYGMYKHTCAHYNRDMKEESGITWAEAAIKIEMGIVLNGEVPTVKGARYLTADAKQLFNDIKKRKREIECIG